MNYNNKSANHGHGLSAAMICAGWDARKGGQARPRTLARPVYAALRTPAAPELDSPPALSLAQVYSLPIGGTLAPVKWAVDGSGSSYIWGFCDAEFREGFTRAEAQAFVLQATCLAMSTDGSSGGCVRLVTVDASGAERTYHPQSALPVFYDELPRVPAPVRA